MVSEGKLESVKLYAAKKQKHTWIKMFATTRAVACAEPRIPIPGSPMSRAISHMDSLSSYSISLPSSASLACASSSAWSAALVETVPIKPGLKAPSPPLAEPFMLAALLAPTLTTTPAACSDCCVCSRFAILACKSWIKAALAGELLPLPLLLLDAAAASCEGVLCCARTILRNSALSCWSLLTVSNKPSMAFMRSDFSSKRVSSSSRCSCTAADMLLFCGLGRTVPLARFQLEHTPWSLLQVLNYYAHFPRSRRSCNMPDQRYLRGPMYI
mmetsp:Transcript_3047/g.6832  ORF Transcript_3047/g.6832 Transcript_3047/m.6832 type:complete len:271 (-) Transcript_3047:41-853(-)